METADSQSARPSFRNPVVLACLLALVGLQIADVFQTPMLPFTDVPYHLAAATIADGYGQVDNSFESFFSLETFLKPNVFHLYFCRLPFFPSPETANRFFFSLYYLLLPLSMFLAIRSLGGNTWFSLLSLVYTYNFSTHWGFVGFVFALPLLIFFMVLLVRHGPRPGWTTGAGLTLLATAMFFVHVLVALVALAILLATSLKTLRKARTRALLDAAMGLPLAGLVIFWWLSKSDTDIQTFGFLFDYYTGDYWIHWLDRLQVHRFDHMFLLPGDLVDPLAWMLTGLVCWPLGWALLYERDHLRAAVRSCPPALGWFILAGISGWLLLPTRLPGLEFVFYRFSVLVFLGAILFSARLRFDRLHRLLLPFGILLAGGMHAWLYADYFTDFRTHSADLTVDLLPDNTSQPLGALVFDPKFRGGFAYVHAPNYFTVWKRGVVTTALADFKYSNVRRRADRDKLPPYHPWVSVTKEYDRRYDRLQHVLVRGDIPEAMSSDWSSRFVEVRRSGQWALYRLRSPDPATRQPES